MNKERESLRQEWESLLPLFQERLRGKKLIALDFDGTLTPKNNPQFDEAIQTALAIRASEFLREQGAIVEIEDLKREIRETYLRDESVTIFFQEKLGISRSFIEEAYNSVEKWRFIKRNPGLMTMLTELVEKGYKLALASNSPEQENLLALERLGVEADVFVCMVNMDDVKHSKPYRDTFDQVLIKSGFPVEECVFVGDSLKKDIRGALGLKMDGILVGEVSDEAVAWVPEVYDLPRLFV